MIGMPGAPSEPNEYLGRPEDCVVLSKLLDYYYDNILCDREQYPMCSNIDCSGYETVLPGI